MSRLFCITIQDTVARMGYRHIPLHKAEPVCSMCHEPAGHSVTTIQTLYGYQHGEVPKAICPKCTSKLEELRDITTRCVPHQEWGTTELWPNTPRIITSDPRQEIN